MSDELAPKPAKMKPRGKAFKAGFDVNRWLGGRGKKSPEQKQGEEILLAVIWEELSREFDTGSMKPLETPETVDALRLMVRTWIKKRPELIAERIAGKVQDRVDVTSGGQAIGWRERAKENNIDPNEIKRIADEIASKLDNGSGDGSGDSTQE